MNHICELCNNEIVKDNKMCEICGWNSKNKYLYMLVPNEAEWEDMVLMLNIEDAIIISKRYYKNTVQIFVKKEDSIKYKPMYKYFENGILK